MRLVRAALALSTGQASLTFRGPSRLEVAAVMPRGRPLAALRFTGLEPGKIRPVPFLPQAPDIQEYYQKYGFPEAERFGDAGFGGCIQELPADPTLCVAWQMQPRSTEATEVFIAAVYGETREEAIQKAREELQAGVQAGFEALASAEATWWEDYWQQAAQVSLPDREIARLYYLGMYKLAGLSMPGTPAATLQGPWIEEHRMPPWNGDYHFNFPPGKPVNLTVAHSPTAARFGAIVPVAGASPRYSMGIIACKTKSVNQFEIVLDNSGSGTCQRDFFPPQEGFRQLPGKTSNETWSSTHTASLSEK